MPKDPSRNVDRYKIRGGHLNEFDFHKQQEEFAEQRAKSVSNLIPGTPPEAAKGTKAAKASKVAKATRATKASKAAEARNPPAPRGASAKKLAARKAAKKK